MSLALCPKLKEPVLLLVTRIMQATEEDGKTLFLKITKDHEGDFFLTLGRPTHELLAEEGEEQVEEQDEDDDEDEGEGPTAERTAGMEEAQKIQQEEDEQGGRAKRVRKSKPQAGEPAMSPKKKGGNPKKKGKKGK